MSEDIDFLRRLTLGANEITKLAHIEYQYHPRTLISQQGQISLFHYHARKKKPYTPPILIVFATVNRPAILDLTSETSFIRKLLDQGLDVYLLDWGSPVHADADWSFADYVMKGLSQTVSEVKKHASCKKIDLLGICQGGVMSLCYALLQKDIRRLVLISTPIDFQTSDNIIYHLTKKIPEFANANAMIPGHWLSQFFISLRPFDVIGKKYLKYIDQIHDAAQTDKFLRIEKWLHDVPDQPNHAFHDWINLLYQQNQLINGQFQIHGQPIILSQLSIPVLNIMAKEDDIVPMSATLALAQHVDANLYHQEIVSGGHIGIYTSHQVAKTLPKMIASWLKKRGQHHGIQSHETIRSKSRSKHRVV